MSNTRLFNEDSEPDLVFKIMLPDNIDQHVLEWFQFQEYQGHLSIELIKLIQDHLISFDQKPINYEVQGPLLDANPDDFFNNLYNWEESNSMPFNKEIKSKKKMLQV